MKRELLVFIICVLGGFIVSCSSITSQENKVLAQAQANVSLVSPEGVRIANSIDELVNIYFWRNERHAPETIIITKIVYGWPVGVIPIDQLNKRSEATAATIYFKTAKGKKGEFFIAVTKH